MKCEKDTECDFVCGSCCRKHKLVPKKKVFFTAKSNNPINPDAKLVKCKLCEEEYWIW